MYNNRLFEKEEYFVLNKFLAHIKRSPKQLNKIHESDCEILKIRPGFFITTSTDSIADEISSGLYKNPYTWGWMSVMSSVSDLAVSGSKPLGLLLSTQWENKTIPEEKKYFYKGVKDALKASNTFLLGGDSGEAGATVITSTILGVCNSKPLSRLGAKEGDHIVLLGKNFGYGPLCAYDFLFSHQKHKIEKKFRPVPKFLNNKTLKYIHASIDTSDGIVNSLEIIGNLNGLSYRLNLSNIFFDRFIISYIKKNKIPLEYLFLSDLGDLQGMLFISQRNYRKIFNSLPPHFIIGEMTSENQRPNVDVFLVRKFHKKNADYKKILNHWLQKKR